MLNTLLLESQTSEESHTKREGPHGRSPRDEMRSRRHHQPHGLCRQRRPVAAEMGESGLAWQQLGFDPSRFPRSDTGPTRATNTAEMGENALMHVQSLAILANLAQGRNEIISTEYCSVTSPGI
jgi:hypothetical protein